MGCTHVADRAASEWAPPIFARALRRTRLADWRRTLAGGSVSARTGPHARACTRTVVGTCAVRVVSHAAVQWTYKHMQARATQPTLATHKTNHRQHSQRRVRGVEAIHSQKDRASSQ
jgi:hypothetical protein